MMTKTTLKQRRSGLSSNWRDFGMRDFVRHESQSKIQGATARADV